jgi:hypothetical protein
VFLLLNLMSGHFDALIDSEARVSALHGLAGAAEVLCDYCLHLVHIIPIVRFDIEHILQQRTQRVTINLFCFFKKSL